MSVDEAICAVWTELGLRPPQVVAARGGAQGSVPLEWLRDLTRRHRLAPAAACSDGPTFDVYISVYPKKNEKALPLPRAKLNSGKCEAPMSYSQLLQYISQTNHRNLWRESYKKRVARSMGDPDNEQSTVNVIEYNVALVETIARFYGCKIIKIKSDPSDPNGQTSDVTSSKSVSKCFESHSNVLPAVCAVETDKTVFVIHHRRYRSDLLNCVTFSPALLEQNYSRKLFIVYQLLQMSKSTYNRGLNIGEITLQDIYLTENLWIQVAPLASSNVIVVNAENISEQPKGKPLSGEVYPTLKKTYDLSGDYDSLTRDDLVSLEKFCNLWVKGCLSNLDYLIHLNILAGRTSGNPAAHHIVPWVTDFSSRCGKQWRDLTKSKYRLNKGDRQLDMTYEVIAKDSQSLLSVPQQIPHHVPDVLSDITYYVYMARRTPKSTLCHYVRSNWVPAEYPSSIQRMQEWTPDECIPEFFTDPNVFRSIHEDLPNLETPAWATCVEDFIIKHREALESIQVSESLHHWIDLTFGYKLSGSAAIKSKNVCLSLVDNHTELNRAGPVQLFTCPHPARLSHNLHSWGEKLPPRIIWHKEKKTAMKANESSDDISDDDANLPQNLSNLHIPSSYKHSRSLRNKSTSRSRRHSKKNDTAREASVSPSHSVSESKERSSQLGHHHFKVQKSELGKSVIYLPKEYNPVSQLTAVESLYNFKLKTFYSNNIDGNIESTKKSDTFEHTNSYKVNKILNTYNPECQIETNSFTNQMFEQQNYFKRYNKVDSKDKKDRMFNVRLVTHISLFKDAVLSNRRKDMQVLGCIIVELFLYEKLRPLATKSLQSFSERYKTCRLVLKKNMNTLPKCIKYIVCLLLQINVNGEEKFDLNALDCLFPCVSDKGLPQPSSLQLLQPLLSNHLFPFPAGFPILYMMATVLHEYSITERELGILCSFECDGQECSKYQSFDKTRLFFIQKIAESKVYSCSLHLENYLNKLNSYSQFDSVELFIPYFIELLQNKNTCILAAWYLFDPIAKALGPLETNKKLLKLILNLYDEHIMEKGDVDAPWNEKHATIYTNKKSVKLYHNIFLLQLIVRFGLQCFLENFISHLVEAVGGYKDIITDDIMHSHVDVKSIKKLTYCEESLKVSNNPHDMMSPDTSFGSENISTPCADKESSVKDVTLESDVFHFESDCSKEVFSPKSASEVENNKSWDYNKTKIKCLLEEMDMECSSPNLDAYLDHAQAVEATESICGGDDDDIKVLEPDVESNKETGTSLSSEHKFDPVSPSINVQASCGQTFISYLDSDDNDFRNNTKNSDMKFLNSGSSRASKNKQRNNRSLPNNPNEVTNSVKDYKISEMTSESLIWLAHRLGPVLTCKFITRNLLKMLTLCYIGQDNLLPSKEKPGKGLDSLCIANGRLVGDKNAAKVIECLTSIAALFGEQLILLQYFPHMGDLIASCRRRISAPLEGGLIACLQLLRYLVPYLSDVKLMEQLQDIILKNILHPTVRLISSTRSTFPNGHIARSALARKFLETLYVISLRIGPEMTRKHLCVPALQRFCVSFDKAYGKVKEMNCNDTSPSLNAPKDSDDNGGTSFIEICRDGTIAEWRIRGEEILPDGDMAAESTSPPQMSDKNSECPALEEIQSVFTHELAYQSYISFTKFVGEETMQRSLKNYDMLKELSEKHHENQAGRSPLCNEECDAPMDDKLNKVEYVEKSYRKSESVPFKKACNEEETSNANSFGSGVVVIGNRIDVQDDPNEDILIKSDLIQSDVLNIVSFKMSNGVRSSRHLRGDWLMYWEHEIGRPDKENTFNLKHIKLQTFSGHTHSVRNIICLDNENSFMTGSKDKTVKLWSLRNQGDGTAISSCQWTYTGHRKGILSLSFLESQRLSVSTDSIVHIWDPYVESTIAQLDSYKTAPVSIVKAMAAPSALILAATTDTVLKVIDAKTCSYTHELKVTFNPSTFIRCICVSPSGKWVAVGLATGHLSLLDSRTGMLINHWKGHDGEVLQLVTINESEIVSSSLDQTVSVWSTIDGKLKFQLKGSTEPVHCLATYYDELISGTTNNRIGVHVSIDQDASFSSTKLRSDTFKGVLTSMAVLPLNRMLLLGSESGNVSLLC